MTDYARCEECTVITNERQYRITNAQLGQLRAALEGFDRSEAITRTGSVALADAERDALGSQVGDLVEQVSEYEALKSGAVGTLMAKSLEELPSILIRARIARGLPQRELADALGVKEQQIQRYECENYASASLSRLVEVAEALDLEVNQIAELWGEIGGQGVAASRIAAEWRRFPLREMHMRNWFEGILADGLEGVAEDARALFEEFIGGVLPRHAPALLRSHVRSGSKMDTYALLAWKCRILHLADKHTPENDFRVRAAGPDWLKGLVQCSRHADGPRRAQKYLWEAGIRLVFEPRLEHTHLDGAVLLWKGHPVIGLTLRYDRLDNFWFALLHEVIHVIKHLRKGRLEDVFDDLDAAPDDTDDDLKAKEKEADELAGDALIPHGVWETALARYVQTPESIRELAAELRISPAIIAGRIRWETGNYMILTELVGKGEVRTQFAEVKFGQ